MPEFCRKDNLNSESGWMTKRKERKKKHMLLFFWDEAKCHGWYPEERENWKPRKLNVNCYLPFVLLGVLRIVDELQNVFCAAQCNNHESWLAVWQKKAWHENCIIHSECQWQVGRCILMWQVNWVGMAWKLLYILCLFRG